MIGRRGFLRSMVGAVIAPMAAPFVVEAVATAAVRAKPTAAEIAVFKETLFELIRRLRYEAMVAMANDLERAMWVPVQGDGLIEHFITSER